MQRRTAMHGIVDPRSWSERNHRDSAARLVVCCPVAVAAISAQHFNQHRIFFCGWCELRDRLILDIVRLNRLSPSINPNIR
jgi:hypothetical protein